MVSAFACPAFFNLLERKNTAALVMLAEKYMGAFANDGVQELEDFHESGKQACDLIRQAMAPLVVLLVPTPGRLGTSPMDVSNIISYEAPKAQKDASKMDLLGTLQMFFQEDKFWQEASDEVLQLGTSTMKFGDELESLVGELRNEVGSGEISEAFSKSVGRYEELRKALRKNATNELEELIRARVECIIVRMCKTTEFFPEISGHIALVTRALAFSPTAKGIMELKSTFMKWQAGMDKELSEQKLLSLADTVVGQGPWPLHELKKSIDKACASKDERLDPETVKKLQTVSWAMERLAQEAGF